MKKLSDSLAVNIIPASDIHIPALEMLEGRGWKRSQRPDFNETIMSFVSRFDLADVRVVIMNDEVLGYYAIGPRTPLISNRHVMRLRAILVAPNRRRRGLGSLLLADAEQFAVSRGASKLTLTVLSTNPAAIRFYERHGYACESRLVWEFHIGEQFIDDMTYAKWIGSGGPSEKNRSERKEYREPAK